MLVDPFTVVAQVVNFLILVTILKFVLYDRIIDAIDARQERIAQQLERAEAREADADREAQRYEQQRAELRQEHDERIEEAEEEAEQRRRELVDQARRDVAEDEDRWREAVARQRDRLLDELRTGTAERVLEISRRVLADLADEQLERRIIEVFARRLEDADGEVLHSSGGVLQVHTAFDLDEVQREHVEAAVRKHVGDARELEFSTVPELIGGIELHLDGHELGWNVDAYLDELGRQLHGLLQQEEQEEQADQAGHDTGAPR